VLPAAASSCGPTGVFGATCGGGGAIPFALDGTPQCANNSSANSLVLPAFSTTYTNDIVYVVGYNNSNTAETMIVSDTASKLTSTTPRASSNNGTATNLNIVNYAALTSALSSDVVTVTFGGTGFASACVFAFSGIHAASPFDSNGAIPLAGNNSSCSFTTTNANDILVGLGSNNAAADSGFTLIYGSNFLFAEYQPVTSTQPGSAAPNTFTASICDAIIKGP
jgi:hypothetical protein